jgi:hypothetical protein
MNHIEENHADGLSITTEVNNSTFGVSGSVAGRHRDIVTRFPRCISLCDRVAFSLPKVLRNVFPISYDPERMVSIYFVYNRKFLSNPSWSEIDATRSQREIHRGKRVTMSRCRPATDPDTPKVELLTSVAQAIEMAKSKLRRERETLSEEKRKNAECLTIS